MNQSKLQPALIGGAALGLMSQIPILNLVNCACCAWVIGGGVLAAFIYFRGVTPPVPSPYGDAAILGLLTGAIGAVVGAIVSVPIGLVASAFGGGFQQAIQQAMENMPPEVQMPPWVENLAVSGGGVMGVIVTFFITLVFGLIINSIFATAGSLIGAAIFAPKTTTAA